MALGAARAAAAAPTMGNVGYSTPFSPPVDARAARADAAAQARARDLEAARDAERVAREAEAREREEDAEKEERRRNGGKPRLRTVLLPHATLPRFLAIASGNTARNLETCGLLLGREVVKGKMRLLFFSCCPSPLRVRPRIVRAPTLSLWFLRFAASSSPPSPLLSSRLLACP
jgi:hypothetical protein